MNDPATARAAASEWQVTLSDLLAPVRRRLVIGAVLSGLGAACAMLPFVAVAEIGRTLAGERLDRSGLVWTWAAVAVGAVVAHSLLYSASLKVCHVADADFRLHVRRRLARHLTRLPLGWFTRRGSAAVKKAVTDVVAAALSPLVGLVYLFLVDWRFSLVVLAWVLLPIVVSIPFIQRGYTANSDVYDDALGEATRATVELAEGMEVAKAYGTRSGGLGRFADAVDGLVRVCVRWTAALGRPVMVTSALVFPSTLLVVVLAAGLWFADRGWITAPDVLPFVVVALGLPASAMQIGQLMAPIREAQLGAAALSEVLSSPGLPEPTLPRSPDGARVVLDRGRIVELGTHPELVDSGGLYGDFWAERTRAAGWTLDTVD